MSRQDTSFIFGYHGCDKKIAQDVVNGKSNLKKSSNDYDWLGHGIYFWQNDPKRALDWANHLVKRKKISESAVVGAIIDLRNCLDLTTFEATQLVKQSYLNFEQASKTTNIELPKNENLTGDFNDDLLIRNLDCAVINEVIKTAKNVEPFDTVKGIFYEGSEIYPNAGFKEKTHTQISVINENCILGYFIPRKI